jgi:hypothetical protein
VVVDERSFNFYFILSNEFVFIYSHKSAAFIVRSSNDRLDDTLYVNLFDFCFLSNCIGEDAN